MSSLRQPFVSGVVDRSRSVTRVLYTFFHNIATRCNQLDSNLANLEATVEMGLILVTFSDDNAVVARAL